MLTILNSESLWIGTDMIQFNAIRDILDREKIKYKYKTYNHLGEKRLRKSTGCNVEFA